VESSEHAQACLDVRTTELAVGDDRFLIVSYAVPRWHLPRELTRAERDVVQAVLEGASRGDIARRRGTSSRTIANLLANAFRKLGVQSKIELAAKLASCGALTPEAAGRLVSSAERTPNKQPWTDGQA
jgi:DNA-binding CsgD family transcriptional regulator